MIPKVIHYCWFGGKPLPESAKKCIDSWRKFLPDYEVKEWNESNYNVHKIPYIHEAYDAKKYAFVSDYARYDILHQFGGVYFDTDVEVIQTMDDIIEKGPYMGIEVPAKSNITPLVNPGLGIGAPANLTFYKKILDYYRNLHFLGKDGKPNEVTIVTHTSKVLAESGMQPVNEIQQVESIWIYPVDYFNPLNDLTAELKITENTRSIHWYTKTWEKKRNPIIAWTTRRIHRFFGINSLKWLRILTHR